jgi:hypothetical protein
MSREEWLADGKFVAGVGTRVGQPTVSHHVRKHVDVGFVNVHKDRTSTIVTVNPACRTGLPHAADVVMGVLPPQPCCAVDIPEDVTVRAMTEGDWDAVLRIYGEGIATRNATFETEVPDRADLEAKWLSEHRWVAEIDGEAVRTDSFGMPTGTPRERYPRAGGSGIAGRSIRNLPPRRCAPRGGHRDTRGVTTTPTEDFDEHTPM